MHNHDELIALANQMFGDQACTKANTQSLISLACEETGEMAGAIRSYWGRSYRPDVAAGDADAVLGEIGDCYVILGRIANLFGKRPEECLAIALRKLELRLQAKLSAETKPVMYSEKTSDAFSEQMKRSQEIIQAHGARYVVEAQE